MGVGGEASAGGRRRSLRFPLEMRQRKMIYGEGALKAPVPHELMGSVRSPNK